MGTQVHNFTPVQYRVQYNFVLLFQTQNTTQDDYDLMFYIIMIIYW